DALAGVESLGSLRLQRRRLVAHESDPEGLIQRALEQGQTRRGAPVVLVGVALALLGRGQRREGAEVLARVVEMGAGVAGDQPELEGWRDVEAEPGAEGEVVVAVRAARLACPDQVA